MANEKVVVRFPPSPTGFLHVGNVRTMIYNYLFARKNGGTFLLRIEDTDKERSKKEYEEAIYEDMKWLGLDYDNHNSVWRSSERNEIYIQKIQEFIRKGAAYVSEESEGENREVVRFKNPGGKIKFTDLIRGEIEMEVGDLGDFIIARNIEDPLYHLAVCIDDSESGITHIIRGDDHISNTPRQILIIEALGGKRPIYAHMPLVLAEDKSKLSKRKHGEKVSLRYYKEKGYTPEAIVNFLAMIGWNPGTPEEIFSLEELVKVFDLSKVQKKGGIFDIKKLRWMNKEHMKLKPEETKQKIGERIGKHFGDREVHPDLIEMLFERIEVLSDIDNLIQAGELDYFFNEPKLDVEKIAWKDQTKENAKENLHKVSEILGKGEAFEEDFLRSHLRKLTEIEGKGNVFWPLRYSLSGREKSPDPLSLIKILGIEESKKRITDAIAKI